MYSNSLNVNMKYFLIFLASLASVHCELKSGLRARFGRGNLTDVDDTIFFDLPKNVTQAVSFGWKETARPEGPLSCLVMYCPENYTVCTLYDDTEYVAGVQVALEKSRVFNTSLDWNIQGFTNWTTEDGKEHLTKQIYYVDEDFLATSKEDRIASRNASQILQLDSVWLSGHYGKLVRIPRSRSDIENKTVFTKQGCYRMMGQHYFYNTTTETQCNSYELYPWSLITGADSLIATGFMTLGSYPVQSGERNWFDAIANSDSIKVIVPNGPPCFYEATLLTCHIYYVEEPWNITCPPQ